MPKRKIEEVDLTPPGSEGDESSNSSGATDSSVDVSVKGERKGEGTKQIKVSVHST